MSTIRYIALVWGPSDVSSSERAQLLNSQCLSAGWKAMMGVAGLVVFVAPHPTNQLQIFPEGAGILLGTIFARPDTCPFQTVPLAAKLTADLALRIADTGGQELVTRYWGDYVALLQDPHGQNTHVVRGPCAALNCLYTLIEGVHIYTSDAESLASICATNFRVDWWQLARTFLGPPMPGPTHLEGLREIVPGCGHQVTAGRLRERVLWSPLSPRRPIIASRVAAQQTLHDTIRRCVQAQASTFEHIVVALSGGLDSSIVLSCLRDSPIQHSVTCFTQFAEGTDSDERRYARLAAARSGFELFEQPRSVTERLEHLEYQALTEVSPGLRIPTVERLEPDFARRIGADAIFRGHGGDELFCRNRADLYVADAIRAGTGLETLFGLAIHAAVMEGDTLWAVLASAVWRALIRRPVNFNRLLARDIENATLLRRDVVAALMESPAPALPYPHLSQQPPGRQWQGYLLFARRTTAGQFDRPDDPHSVAPLLAQPVVELCLAIPTWYQMIGRQSRSLARDGFASDLPWQIVTRTDKGGGEDVAMAILDANRQWLRELLLDGLLAHSGIIDLKRLEATLSDAPSADSVNSVPVFDAAGAELWARSIHAQERRPHQNVLRKVMPNDRSSVSP